MNELDAGNVRVGIRRYIERYILAARERFQYRFPAIRYAANCQKSGKRHCCSGDLIRHIPRPRIPFCTLSRASKNTMFSILARITKQILNQCRYLGRLGELEFRRTIKGPKVYPMRERNISRKQAFYSRAEAGSPSNIAREFNIMAALLSRLPNQIGGYAGLNQSNWSREIDVTPSRLPFELRQASRDRNS